MASDLPSPLHPSVVDKLDPAFRDTYNRAQAPRPRADQVPYENWKASPSSYGVASTAGVSRPPAPIASDAVYKCPVTTPPGEIDIQVYVPTEDSIARNLSASASKALPALINYHGGGFVIGDLTSDINLCRNICDALGCLVINVDYRTAPEFPHPTPAIDSWDALCWVFRQASELNVDPTRVAVSGLSAGACLAAVVALMARDAGDPSVIPHPLVAQVLIVPVTDARYVPLSGSADPATCPYKSYITLEHAPCLPLQRLVWFYNLWLGDSDTPERRARAADWRASPLLAGSLAGLPPASIHCGGVDPLVDEGRAYHDRLVAEGTPSDIHVYEGQGHPFSQWDADVPAARDFLVNCVGALRKAFGVKD